MTMQKYVHFTSVDALKKIQSSKKIVALTESRVYFSLQNRSHSIPSTMNCSITVSGQLRISRHPRWIIPSFWELYKKNQYVSPTGYDLELNNINSEDPFHVTADATLIRAPIKRRIVWNLRRISRYLFIDILLSYGSMLLLIMFFVSSYIFVEIDFYLVILVVISSAV